jgi:glycosyltransferase involved in cell wall biosynthesis
MAINIHLIRTCYPHWGSYASLNRFADYINRERYNLDVQLVPDSDEDFPIRNRVARDKLRDFIQERGMQWYKLSDLTAEVKAFCKCCWKKVDVIHYLDGEHSAQYLPWLLDQSGVLRTKTVATFHQAPELLDSLIIKGLVARFDYVTVVSPEQVRYFRELLPPDRIHSILLGVDVDYFRPGNQSKAESKFKCITVGHYLRDFRAVREVAERLSDYEDIEFHVVSSQATEVENLPNVTVHSGIDDASLLNLYQQSDVLFLPLLQSTANNSLLEGIACGLPVVSTLLPSVNVYLPGEEAILVRDNDPERLTDAILRLMHNPGERKNMGRLARKRAEELGWRNIVPQYEAIYSKLASR